MTKSLKWKSASPVALRLERSRLFLGSAMEMRPVLTEADLRRLDTFSRLTFEHATRSQAKWLQSLAVRVMNSGR